MSLSYSELETTFEPVPEHIFATHLVENVIGFKGQQANSRADASKLWLLRSDGRLVAACIIKSQDVLGFCEWELAAGGLAKELHVDAGNDVRLAVMRGSAMRHEIQSRDALFQAQVSATADLAGVVTGLAIHEGRAVYVAADGYIEGPFTVTGGAITLDEAWTGPVTVGLWKAPVWEGMPRYFITRDDLVVKRPGRIYSATVEVIDTTSIAIGANGQPAENVPLQVTGDLVDVAPAPRSGPVARHGMLGHRMGTTLVITQTKPGELHVRDITLGEKL